MSWSVRSLSHRSCLVQFEQNVSSGSLLRFGLCEISFTMCNCLEWRTNLTVFKLIFTVCGMNVLLLLFTLFYTRDTIKSKTNFPLGQKKSLSLRPFIHSLIHSNCGPLENGVLGLLPSEPWCNLFVVWK